MHNILILNMYNTVNEKLKNYAKRTILGFLGY